MDGSSAFSSKMFREIKARSKEDGYSVSSTLLIELLRVFIKTNQRMGIIAVNN